MVILQPVLEVREIPNMWRNYRSHFPSIKEFVNETKADYEDSLCSYMFNGKIIMIYGTEMGYDWVNPQQKIKKLTQEPYKVGDKYLGLDLVLTDGKWFWHSVYIYYLRTYHISLAPGFVADAQRNQWLIEQDKIDHAEIDDPALRACIFQGAPS